MALVRKNERSWAIEIISQINTIVNHNNLKIKRAGGETTVSVKKGKSMFPDVLLYGDSSSTIILQGWELKMPDVPITDERFIADAQRKAKALNLKSCIIWNFTYAMLYVFNESSNKFEIIKKWENLNISTREDVQTYRDEWEKTLRDVILDVNEFLVNNKLSVVSIDNIVSNNAINLLIDTNKDIVAQHLKEACNCDTRNKAFLQTWWNQVSSEYLNDEPNEYRAYAKNIILNWAYRILFAHLIKRTQHCASIINNLDYDKTPTEANIVFQQITSQCDFYNVFEELPLNTILPSDTWSQLIELSLLLKNYRLEIIDQKVLQNILEGCINTSRRELNGQYTTPQVLARILAKITIVNLHSDVADVCCGTGTIPHEILKIKKSAMSSREAVETTWASDKYKLPLQIANISMASYDTVNVANRIFQENALKLAVGDIINLVNPANGQLIEERIPEFHAICSNLPFVSFENMPVDDKRLLPIIKNSDESSSRFDLSFFIAIAVEKLLQNNGRLGIITSNSWLGTMAGDLFYKTLIEHYNVEQVHISGKGRWFKNAQVVATILVLQKRQENDDRPLTSFFVWNKSLEEIASNTKFEETLVNGSLLHKALDSSVMKLSQYSAETINDLRSLNISYNSLFHEVSWLMSIKDVLIPLQSVFNVFRGSRRGWDALFFPTKENEIEKRFLKPALFNARNVTSLVTSPDRFAFCCGEEMDFLEKNARGAYNWIQKFINVNNNVGKPLVEALKKSNEKWYEMKPTEVASIYTMMNPDLRIFFGKFNAPTFINQRLIGLKCISSKTDIDLCHALLNCVLMKFFIEAVGFGRGLGVLDINKNSVKKCFMLNPSILSNIQKDSIKKAFKPILSKKIMTIEEELQDHDWIKFNKCVLKAYSIEEYYEKIADSLMSMRKMRKTARE